MDVILSLAPEKLLGCEEKLNENVCESCGKMLTILSCR